MRALNNREALNISVAEGYPLDAQSNALEFALLAFLAFTVCFHAAEAHVNRNPSLLPPDMTADKKYLTIYHFTKGAFFFVSLLLALPSLGSLVQFVFSDSLTIMLPSPVTERLVKITGALSIMPAVADLAAQRNINTRDFIHHVLTVVFVVVCIGWRDAASIGVFYAVTSYCSFALLIAFGLCDIKAPLETCVWWLTLAKWTSSLGFGLGQIGIMASMLKIYKAYSTKADANTTLVNVCFAASIVLAIALNATQWVCIHMVHGMAKRRKAQIKAKTL